MKIEVGKFYKTRSGQKARIYTVDGGGSYPIHGAIYSDDAWTIVAWNDEGSYTPKIENIWDIVSEWQEPLVFDPKCLPAWAKYIAMDNDNRWFWYSEKPGIKTYSWALGDNCDKIPHDYAPKNFTGDWSESLFSVNELKNDQP